MTDRDEVGTPWTNLCLYSIVTFFQLAMENNSNILDCLIVPEPCVVRATAVGRRARARRRLFLHRGVCHTFAGYAFALAHKMRLTTTQPGSVRAADIDAHGYDLPFSSPLVRLLDEAAIRVLRLECLESRYGSGEAAGV